MATLREERKKDKGKRVLWAGLLGVAVITSLHLLRGGSFALLTPDQKAYREFENGNFEAAAEEFSDPLWRGIAHFRNGDFEQAGNVFSGIQSVEGQYNYGNSLVMLGKYAAAIEAYDRALSVKLMESAEVNKQIAQNLKDALDFDGGNMTDGKIGSDGITFEKGKSPPSEDAGEEVVQGGELDDAQLREVWLRKVQTKPADFLKSKFMYQQANTAEEGGSE